METVEREREIGERREREGGLGRSGFREREREREREIRKTKGEEK